MSARTSVDTVEIDAARLASGVWCHSRNRTVGEGDIAASYSADLIGMESRIRQPFAWRGGLWVAVGRSGTAADCITKVYRLEHPQAFEGKPTSYGETEYVLRGPCVVLVAGAPEQPDLFAEL